MQEATNKVVNIQEAKKEPWEIEWERCKPYIAKAVKHQDSYTDRDWETLPSSTKDSANFLTTSAS